MEKTTLKFLRVIFKKTVFSALSTKMATSYERVKEAIVNNALDLTDEQIKDFRQLFMDAKDAKRRRRMGENVTPQSMYAEKALGEDFDEVRSAYGRKGYRPYGALRDFSTRSKRNVLPATEDNYKKWKENPGPRELEGLDTDPQVAWRLREKLGYPRTVTKTNKRGMEYTREARDPWNLVPKDAMWGDNVPFVPRAAPGTGKNYEKGRAYRAKKGRKTKRQSPFDTLMTQEPYYPDEGITGMGEL